LKKIAFVVIVLLAVFSSATIVRVNSATGPSMHFSPDTLTVPPNTPFVLNLTINNVVNMRAWDIVLIYGNIITLNSVDTINDTVFTDGPGLAIVKIEVVNSTHYFAEIARTTESIVPGSGTGSALVARLNFLAVSIGTTEVVCTSAEAMDSDMISTPMALATATITVAQPTPPPSKTVGGWSFSVANTAFPASDIGLAIAIIAVLLTITTAVYFKGIKRRKEKQ
jgi:hypothetical protein